MAETNGVIYGIVTEEGAVKAQNEVVLMDHSTLSIIAKTRTDANGGYLFNNLDPDKADYMLFTVDNDGGVPKNALIKDYVQPVTSNEGTVAGSFTGVLDALAPVASGLPMFSPGSVRKWVLARMHGSGVQAGVEVEYGGFGGISDLTDNPTSPEVVCPIPSNLLLRGMTLSAQRAGWAVRPTAWGYSAPDRPKAELMPAINTPAGPGNLTLLVTHYTDPAKPLTYSSCFSMTPNTPTAMYEARATAGLFANDSFYYYSTDCRFNVCVEAGGALRLKWLVDNNAVPNAASKRDVFVAQLPASRWQIILVRIGASADPIKVDVCDPWAGTLTTYTPGAALESLNQHTGYGSLWQQGVPVRAGFLISGPHNQAVNNSFNNWDASNGWGWAAFSEGTGVAGPWAWWNRALTDAETTSLLTASFDTTHSLLPRGLAEIYKYAPQIYMPFDEFPGTVPYQTRKGQALAVSPIGSRCVRLSQAYSLRRRSVVNAGEGARLWANGIPHPHMFTVLAFTNHLKVGAGRELFNVVDQRQHAAITADASSDYFANMLYLAIEANGQPRAYFRNAAGGYIDLYLGAQNSPLTSLGPHSLAFVFDTYYGLRVTAYVDGVLWGTVAVAQQQLARPGVGADVRYTFGTQTLLGNTLAYAFVSGQAVIPKNDVELTDMAIFNVTLDAPAIAEIHAAWQLVIGPDSRP